MYTNADSLSNKINELNIRIDSDRPDIICITEILPKNYLYEINNEELAIQRYSCCHNDNMKRGIIIYIANHIKAAQSKMKYIRYEIYINEYIFYDITIGCIYRSPDSQEDNNNNLLELLIKADKSNPRNLFLLGDFNIKEIDWKNNTVNASENSYANKMFCTINNLFLTEIIQEPTRVRENQQPSTLDWVLTHNVEDVDNIEVGPPLGKSDHAVITFNIKSNTSCENHTQKYNYYRGDYTSINNELKMINWTNMFTNMSINKMWHYIEH